MPASPSFPFGSREVLMEKVIIGVDPHKLSATIEVVDRHETVLAAGRFATDKAGYAAMRKHVAAWPEAVWAVEGSNGAGRSLAQRLLADGEHVVDVPAKLAARARMLDTGHGRKTDAHDAHSVAVAAVRAKELRVLALDPELEALRMLVDRREELARQRTQTANRLQRLLAELTPGKAKKDITTGQAKEILAGVRPRDLVGKTRRRLAAEQLTDLAAIDKRIKSLTKGAEGDGSGQRLDVDGTARRRTDRRRPHSRRRRRRDPVRRPQQVRLLDRHRTHRSVFGRTGPAPALPGREQADEPHAPYRRGHPDPPRHRRARLLPTQTRRRQDPPGSHALPQATKSPMRSTDGCSPTRTPRPMHTRRTAPMTLARAREGTAGRLINPARSTFPRTSTLRISHFPDPRARRYNADRAVGRAPASDPSKPPVDKRGEPE
jgi:hypothetical protein